jgi:hypothetical protein
LFKHSWNLNPGQLFGFQSQAKIFEKDFLMRFIFDFLCLYLMETLKQGSRNGEKKTAKATES